jgi:homoserine kinase type II
MAVYTEVSDDELEPFLAGYDLGSALSCKGIAEGVENSNFMLETDKGRFILTLYEKRTRREDLPFFLGLMEHLSERGVSCPLPVHGRDGRALRELCGRPAAMVTFLSGMSIKRITPAHCGELGAALAALHQAGQGFDRSRPNALSLDGWTKLFAETESRADEVRPGLSAELAAELATLKLDWPVGLPSGVIHADLFPDNVFFRGDKLSGLIDFYFACNDFLAYDLAICLNAWCFETDGPFNATKARALLSGYERVRPLSEAERAALPLLCRGSALRFLLTRLYDWLNHPPGAFVRPKDPLEYARKLRFHQGVKSVGEYGLDPTP